MKLPKITGLVLLLWLLAAPLAQARVESAVLTFESRQLSSEGVEKTTKFQERFIRTEDTVWSMRMLPLGTPPHQHQPGDHQHKHDTNFVLAAKWIERGKDGQASLRFVRHETRSIIAPRRNEYASLGFDGSWEHAAYLLDRAELKSMQPLKRKAPAGCRWYERTGNAAFTRVFWDQQRQLPRQIESGSLDGNRFNRIVIEPRPAMAPYPWTQLSGYRAMAYEDLLD